MNIYTCLNNPIIMWFRWVVFKVILERKYKNKNLKIGNMTFFSECQFGRFNVMYSKVYLHKVSLGLLFRHDRRKILSLVENNFCLCWLNSFDDNTDVFNG